MLFSPLPPDCPGFIAQTSAMTVAGVKHAFHAGRWMRLCADAKRKNLRFLNKKKEDFIRLRMATSCPTQADKSFLVLFFKKERLSFSCWPPLK
jgi:hypothetical protein